MMTDSAQAVHEWPRTIPVPFARHLGFEISKFGGGESELRYTAKPEHLNTHGMTHGGALMALLDIGMAVAARSVTPDHGVVTIEMKTTFMAPASGPLVARGKLLTRTAALGFTEARVYDAHERLCAHATGTFKYVKRRLPSEPGGGGMYPPSTA
jgi:uncharacterized protein (TIGR00369 family)